MFHIYIAIIHIITCLSYILYISVYLKRIIPKLKDKTVNNYLINLQPFSPPKKTPAIKTCFKIRYNISIDILLI